VLTAATLVSATVVLLWGIKIFHGGWTGRKLASNKRPPAKKRFATKLSLPRRRKPSVPVCRWRVRRALLLSNANTSRTNGEWHGADPPMRPSALHGRGLIRCGGW